MPKGLIGGGKGAKDAMALRFLEKQDEDLCIMLHPNSHYYLEDDRR